MSKSDERRKRAALRAHYEKKAASKMADTKELLQKAVSRCSELEHENAVLRQKTDADAETIRHQDALITALQSKLNLTDQELASFKKNLDLVHQAANASGAAKIIMDQLLGTVSGGYGLMP